MVNDINNLSTSGFEIDGLAFGTSLNRVKRANIKSKKFFQQVISLHEYRGHISSVFTVLGVINEFGSTKKELEELYEKQYKDIDNDLIKFALDNWDNLEKLCQVTK